MTTAAVRPDHLLRLDEWDALPEHESGKSELVEGVLLVVPAPAPLHQRVMVRLTAELDRQLPDELTALADVDIVVQASHPPTVRAPDVVVVPSARLERNPKRLDAADVLLAVEIASPGTERTDRVMKSAEYAEAGIPHYWLAELGPPPTATVYALQDRGYVELVSTGATLEVTRPAPLAIDVPALTRRR